MILCLCLLRDTWPHGGLQGQRAACVIMQGSYLYVCLCAGRMEDFKAKALPVP